jgi:hypothetical protein
MSEQQREIEHPREQPPAEPLADARGSSTEAAESSTPPVAGAAPVETAQSERRPARKPELVRPGSLNLWLLPTTGNAMWPVGDVSVLAAGQAAAVTKTRILTPKLKAAAEADAAGSAREYLRGALDSKFHDSLFALLSRAAVGGAWFLLAAVGLLRFPGWLKELDAILLLMGLGFLGYAVIRYGGAALRWHQTRVDASQFMGHWQDARVTSKLLDRLDKALALRVSLPPEERGQRPDDELVDTGAYRKLIKEGVTTRAELCALADAVALRLGLSKQATRERPMADVAEKAGLDIETAIFYRDLVRAALELSLEPDLP